MKTQIKKTLILSGEEVELLHKAQSLLGTIAAQDERDGELYDKAVFACTAIEIVLDDNMIEF